MELFVGALQAFCFSPLAVVYLAIAVNHADEHAEEQFITFWAMSTVLVQIKGIVVINNKLKFVYFAEVAAAVPPLTYW